MKKCYEPSGGDFQKLIEGNKFFMDKTLFIKEFLNEELGEVQLITRPRRFGKSLNISMLNCFLDIREKSEYLFKNFKIWHDKETMSHINKHPVIYLNFKNSPVESYGAFIAFIKSKMSKIYSSHKYVLDGMTDQQELSRFEQVMTIQKVRDEHELQILRESLEDLCKYLHDYYNKKVILLIDEYDNPIRSSYGQEHSSAVNNFCKEFYGDALKDNKYLHRALVIGILQIAKNSIFSGSNNTMVYTILDKEYNQYFGFTQEEIAPIIEREGLDLETAKDWYNGYNFSGLTIYNPFSIINYLKKRRAESYWVNTAGEQKRMIMSSLKCHTEIVVEDLNELVRGKSISSTIEGNLAFDDLGVKKKSFWTLLVHAGYLTPITRLSSHGYELIVPNNEIKDLFKDIIEDILQETGKSNLILMLIRDNYEKFTKELSDILKKTLSYYDTAHESFFHAIMMQYAITLNGEDNNYEPKSNPEAGEGRPDIVVENRNSGMGLILEVKKAKNVEDLEDKAEEGMNQIKEKEYQSYFNEKIKVIKLASIAFKGKKFILQTEKIVLS